MSEESMANKNKMKFENTFFLQLKTLKKHIYFMKKPHIPKSFFTYEQSYTTFDI